jgi:hypothetical protein
MIYFAYCESMNSVKIGTTTELNKRLSALQTGCPAEIRLLGTIPGSRDEEVALHRDFDHLRTRGEWFQGDEALMEHIHLLIAKHRGPKILASGLALKDEPCALAYSPDLDYFVDAGVVHPLLCYLTSKAVGHKVAVYEVNAWVLKNMGVSVVDGDVFYQVMKWNDARDDAYEFWEEHAGSRPQFFVTPEAACAAYVASFLLWR